MFSSHRFFFTSSSFFTLLKLNHPETKIVCVSVCNARFAAQQACIYCIYMYANWRRGKWKIQFVIFIWFHYCWSKHEEKLAQFPGEERSEAACTEYCNKNANLICRSGGANAFNICVEDSGTLHAVPERSSNQILYCSTRTHTYIRTVLMRENCIHVWIFHRRRWVCCSIFTVFVPLSFQAT